MYALSADVRPSITNSLHFFYEVPAFVLEVISLLDLIPIVINHSQQGCKIKLLQRSEMVPVNSLTLLV